MLLGRFRLTLALEHRLNDRHHKLPKLLVLYFSFTLKLQDVEEQLEDRDQGSFTDCETINHSCKCARFVDLGKVYICKDVQNFEHMCVYY